tara:strand:+ start:61573 stop:62247 length:675 start_codon:yes stop_codon:yes gene_type:complete
MLKIDTHIHTSFSKDSEMSLEALHQKCLKTGLNCIAITDHNTIEGALRFKSIASFEVIVGEEINTIQGEITGLFLKEKIPAGLPAIDTVKNIKSQGGLVSIPHPFDIFRSSVIKLDALYEVLPHVDIIEGFNARNTFHFSNKKAEKLAKDHNILTSGVSDAHTAYEVGRTYMEMPEFDGTAKGFLNSLNSRTIYANKVSPLIHILTTFTKTKKKFLIRWEKIKG